MKNKELLGDHKVTIITPKDGFKCLEKKLKHGRNDICPCGSGKKIKHCCVELLDTVYYSTRKARPMSEEERKCKMDGVPYRK